MTTAAKYRIPRHPATIRGLAADTRRVLSQEYIAIQQAQDRETLVPTMVTLESGDTVQGPPRKRTRQEIARATEAAVAEYRRVAEMWGVEV